MIDLASDIHQHSDQINIFNFIHISNNDIKTTFYIDFLLFKVVRFFVCSLRFQEQLNSMSFQRRFT